MQEIGRPEGCPSSAGARAAGVPPTPMGSTPQEGDATPTYEADAGSTEALLLTPPAGSRCQVWRGSKGAWVDGTVAQVYEKTTEEYGYTWRPGSVRIHMATGGYYHVKKEQVTNKLKLPPLMHDAAGCAAGGGPETRRPRGGRGAAEAAATTSAAGPPRTGAAAGAGRGAGAGRRPTVPLEPR